MKKARIFGISGQGGAYLTQFLLNQGCDVSGTSKDARITNFSDLIKLAIQKQAMSLSIAQNNFPRLIHRLDYFELALQCKGA